MGSLWRWSRNGIALATVSGVLAIGYKDQKYQANIRNSEPYKKCLMILRGYSPAMDMLGEPLASRRLETSTAKNICTLTNAKLTIPVYGGRDSAVLYGWSTRDPGGEWTVDKLDIEIESTGVRWTFYEKQYESEL